MVLSFSKIHKKIPERVVLPYHAHHKSDQKQNKIFQKISFFKLRHKHSCGKPTVPTNTESNSIAETWNFFTMKRYNFLLPVLAKHFTLRTPRTETGRPYGERGQPEFNPPLPGLFGESSECWRG